MDRQSMSSLYCLNSVPDNASKVLGTVEGENLREKVGKGEVELVRLGEDLHKRMNFNPFEYSVNRIGVIVRELLGLGLGFKL